MENSTYYEEALFTNGTLDQHKLKGMMVSYLEELRKTAEALIDKSKYFGDELSDEFFNSVDELELFRFASNEKHYYVSLSRSFEQEDENQQVDADDFGASYFIEQRDEHKGILDTWDYELGEEERFISKLKELGYQK